MRATKIGLIGGSGLAAKLSGAATAKRHRVETPFGLPSDEIVETHQAGVSVFALSRHGPGHLLNPSQVPYRANIFALKSLGCTHILASGAVGSLNESIAPRSLVIVDQFIDRTTKRAMTFFDHAAVHVELAEPMCPVLRSILIGLPTKTTVHPQGCYVAMEGPGFSTRAESEMNRRLGGDLIGMTACPEAKLAREAEIAYALIALVTDYDCWRPVQPGVDRMSLLEEIIGNLEAASASALDLMNRCVEHLAAAPPETLASPAHDALQLAIWSNKAAIDPIEAERLSPIWKKYF